MYSRIILSTLSMITLVAAHGKVSVLTGDLGGNGTALGIRGAVVPGAGPNYLTEVDTTIFWSKDIHTDDDLGYTDEAGNNQLSDLSKAMSQSGNTLPQVSSGGSVNGTYHIVTTDGAGPLEALVDESASGKWSKAKSATVTVQPPGDDGYIAAPKESGTSNNKRSRVYGKLSKRAENVNEDYPFAVEIPSGTSCTGTINGISNLCLVKVSNNNDNGPFGSVFAVQMPNSTTSSTSSSASAAVKKC
ncbi:hypothetical protein UA08_06338 [Talaromyces atroroseus]|uniref:Cell surface protein n=1 Tax=Talaromyces atroroseus TaxID=1441469 RepID=A0A225AN11_TALAT|nr:hypothetical protein UA08_06338 [Talaromyces atroroseus]OKL58668.1 hypothetical protein UA08_06338 [Talaromyces atroroseus]